jgi:hypothetical protein
MGRQRQRPKAQRRMRKRSSRGGEVSVAVARKAAKKVEVEENSRADV